MKNKCVQIVLVLALATGLFVTGMQNKEVQPDYILGRPMTEEEIAEQEKITEESMKNPGYVEPEVEVEALDEE